MHRACSERGCPRFAAPGGSRCYAHRRTTTQRGYGGDHQAERQRLAATLPAPCIYGCGRVLRPGDAWVAAHYVDGEPRSPRGVACVPCNQRAKDGQLQPVVAVGA